MKISILITLYVLRNCLGIELRARDLQSGEAYCTSGYVMDTFCITRGKLLDRPDLRSLQHPDKHSIHCLVDVDWCVNSGYQVLVAPQTPGDDYIPDVQLDQFGNDMVVKRARSIGSCSTCSKSGTQVAGFAATVKGTIDKSFNPPLLRVTELLPADTPCVKAPVIPFCFSQDMTVELEGGGTKRMNQLMLGDRVRTAMGSFEPIYSFGHYHPTASAEFVQVSTRNDRAEHIISNQPLELTKDHMVVLENGTAVPASMLDIHTVLQGGHVVTHVTTVVRRGVYSPFTPSGTIVVNGLVASTFIAFSESSSINIGVVRISYQWLAHAFEAPHRMYCRYLSTNACHDEAYNDSGISTWVAGPLEVAHYVMNLPPMMKTLWFVPTVLFLALISVLEGVMHMMEGASVLVTLTFMAIFAMAGLSIKTVKRRI